MLYPAFQATVFTLLMANALYFLLARSGMEALDSVAWLTLLALFEVETRWPAFTVAARTVRLTRMLRLVAAVSIVLATLGYVYQERWPDAFNSGLWIAVVALLEAEVRCGQALVLHPRVFKAAALVLYVGLAALVLVWLVREEWVDAYDAALWLIAFATIENDVLSARERPV